MKYLRFIFFPFALIYGLITVCRNCLFDLKIKREFKFSLPVINIGNLSMGGTGKTPHTEYLIKLLKDNHQLATLSRGYGRKEFGFKIANNESTAKQIGDEPLQFYKKFGNQITVAVESDRVKGVMDLCYEKPETDLVLLDDAYQHRHIKPGFNILLTDFNKPFFNDYILPVGNLRELRKGKKRADVIIVTKCIDFKLVNKFELIKKIKPKASQSVYFSKVNYSKIVGFNTNESLDENLPQNIILVTGIAFPSPLKTYLNQGHNILEHCKFTDHYQFKEKDIDDIHNLLVKFADKKPIIVTTEKDAMRLIGSDFESKIKTQPWFYQTIEVEIDNKEEFDKEILNYVQKNRRDY